MTLPGGSTTDYTYDPLMRVKAILAKDPGQNQIMTRQYQYSAAGNIATKNTEHGNYAYRYDDLYRLAQADNPTLPHEAYTYDALGNRITAAGAPGLWTYNANNELLGYGLKTFTYDPNGNMTRKADSGQETTYIYDVEDRLVKVYSESSSVIADYYYDPFGRRLWKEVDGVRTYFVYSDEGLVGEYDASGDELRTYGWAPNSQWGTDPLFVKIGSQYYWYQNDHQGTPQKIISTSGLVVWSATNDSFGNARIDTEGITNNLRFPGQYYDSETGLHYNWNRYYDPTTGRYLRTDPYGQGLNLYAYCFNNPLTQIDPRGLCAATKVNNSIHDYYKYVTDFWTNQSDTQKQLEEMRKEAKELQELILGSKPGDILTFGFSFGLSTIAVGFGFSLDRIVMSNGQSDWFITGGFGISTPGPSLSIDRGKVWKLDLLKNTDSLFCLSSNQITNGDIKGFSISSNIDIAKGLGIGAEFAIALFAKSEVNGLEYPAPLITVKGGPRVALSPGINLFANWTLDIGG